MVVDVRQEFHALGTRAAEERIVDDDGTTPAGIRQLIIQGAIRWRHLCMTGQALAWASRTFLCCRRMSRVTKKKMNAVLQNTDP